ncbi:MAG TPA: DoxX family protein [Terriglobia bacterium]|nr:DoxX family protein [Terriglobia bacterium]
MSIESSVHSAAPFLRAVLRLVASFLFFCHGLQKLNIFYTGGHLSALLYAACFLELVGGFLMFIGLFTSPVALILALEMVVAYFLAHFPRGRLPIVNGGELAVLYCFIWLYFLAAGPGPMSADSLFRKKSG